MHKSSFDKMKKFKEDYLDTKKDLKILDLGSQDVNGTYAELFQEPGWIYHGTDMVKGKNVYIVLNNPYDWSSIEANSYDVVISGQAFEHIEYFWITILQVNRVLKKNGLACIIAPANGYEHRYPIDCWRYYPDGMKALAKWAKMEVVEAETQWESQNYADDSDQWKDSLLVCMKVVETPGLQNFLNNVNWWIELSKSAHVKKIEGSNDIMKNKDIDLLKTFKKIKQSSITTNPNIFPKWYEAISYLMIVYGERQDLHSSFPEVENKGDLSALLRWASEFGIHEDPRLLTYADFYKKIMK